MGRQKKTGFESWHVHYFLEVWDEMREGVLVGVVIC